MTGRHRATRSSRRVADIATDLNRQLCERHPKGWHLTADGKYYCVHGDVFVESSGTWWTVGALAPIKATEVTVR